MTVPSMPHPGGVTLYIVCSEDDPLGGVVELSYLVAFPGVRTCDIPKFSKEAKKNARGWKELPADGSNLCEPYLYGIPIV